MDPAKHKGLHLGWLKGTREPLPALREGLRGGQAVWPRSTTRSPSPSRPSTRASRTRGYILGTGRSKKRNVVTVRREFGDEQITVLHLKPTFLEDDTS